MGGFLTPDPAVEKWVRMRESTNKYFRWNSRNLGFVGVLGLVIPAGIYYLADQNQNRFHWAAQGPSRKVAATEEQEDA
ncbi:hypothetical protein BGW38_006152 [Lunasporangiospora selenospora]|uniref:Uncharacterized protein n=1 Tax=Lunasporangiospora selenospora TaxID=979761 RepID=A0A9P6G0D8_9FUNG|nr:hypothetical protein BGW38_006152 [Lunasporangiospora selenospora]